MAQKKYLFIDGPWHYRWNTVENVFQHVYAPADNQSIVDFANQHVIDFEIRAYSQTVHTIGHLPVEIYQCNVTNKHASQIRALIKANPYLWLGAADWHYIPDMKVSHMFNVLRMIWNFRHLHDPEQQELSRVYKLRKSTYTEEYLQRVCDTIINELKYKSAEFTRDNWNLIFRLAEKGFSDMEVLAELS